MGHNYGGEPRLVMRAGGIGWINGFVRVMFAIELVLVVAIVVGDLLPYGSAAAALVSVMVLGLFIRAIVPQRFEVYDDRLILVFSPWRWTIGMETIELVRPATRLQAYAYNGIRFATAPGKAVELRRLRSNLFTRPNLIISPEDRELFLVEMNAALARYRHLHGAPA